MIQEIQRYGLSADVSKGAFRTVIGLVSNERKRIFNMSCAAIAAGASGLMIEVHHNPKEALVDGSQMIMPEELRKVIATCKMICKTIIRKS